MFYRLTLLFLVVNGYKLLKDEDHVINNRLFIQTHDSGGEEEHHETNSPEVIQLRSPDSQLLKLSDGEYYLKTIDARTNQAIMINLNEVNTINFRDKSLDMKEEARANQFEPQLFPPFEWTPVIAFDEFPKNRGGHSMHVVGESLVVFGGCYLEVKCFDDLYMFNIRDKSWTFPKTFGQPPTPRSGHSSFINGARIYIFGGTTQKGLMADLHVFDLESRSWNQLFWEGIAPGPRSGHSMVLTNSGYAILFGGYIGDGYSNEVYILDIVFEKWSKPIINGYPPLPREGFGMTYNRNNVWVFGGYATGVVLNDLFELNLDGLTWTQVSSFGSIPKPRQGLVSVKYDQRNYVMGGCDPKLVECYNDLHVLDTNTLHWQYVTVFSGEVVRPSEFGASAFMGQVMLYFGGCHLMNNCTNDLVGLRIIDSLGCPSDCSESGHCRNGRCMCFDGYQAIDCSLKVFCRENCLNRGFCMTSGQCHCYPGYSGSKCQIYIPCPNNCTNEEQGQCRNDGTCQCSKRWYGDGCEKMRGMVEFGITCANDCMGHGDCNTQTGLCICEAGFGGPDCSFIERDELDENVTILEHLAVEAPAEESPPAEEAAEEVTLQPHQVSVKVHTFIHIGEEEEESIQDNTLAPVTDLGNNLLGKKKDVQEFEPDDPKECPEKCNRHGICWNKRCYCELGYTGKRCQASKIKDLVNGIRFRNFYLFCALSFIFGVIMGFVIVRILQAQGATNDFKAVDPEPDDVPLEDDNEDKQEQGDDDIDIQEPSQDLEEHEEDN